MKKLLSKALLLFCIAVIIPFSGKGKPGFSGQDSDSLPATDHIKTGWTFGALPAVAYNTDEGFRYGGLANFFYYGDGETYPDYHHSVYVEWSRTTKGNGLNNLFFDSRTLIPNTRTTIDLMYLTEQALDFYGFNGYEAPYFMDFEDPDHPEYISRMYYRHERKLLRITADMQRRFFHDHWKWIGGAGFFGVQTGPVNIDQLNEDLSADDQLPDVPGIYEEYLALGLIPEDLSEGGRTTFFKAGLIHDTRDNESNPMRGTWNEAFLNIAPGFMGNGDYAYTQLVAIHRHYITLLPEVLSLANRIGYQGKLSGEMPFYMLPFIYSSFKTYDGFGGTKTVRGVRRNRIQGDGIAYGNFELRYKFFRRIIARQDVYLSLNGFVDGARVVQKHPVSYEQTPFEPGDESVHWAMGAGLRVVLNKNFVVALDYGRALRKQDGDSGLYIGLNFLF